MIKLDNLKLVPRHIIKSCSDDMVLQGYDNNRFSILLEEEKSYENANLTPVFICSNDMKEVYTTSVEKIKNLYH